LCITASIRIDRIAEQGCRAEIEVIEHRIFIIIQLIISTTNRIDDQASIRTWANIF